MGGGGSDGNRLDSQDEIFQGTGVWTNLHPLAGILRARAFFCQLIHTYLLKNTKIRSQAKSGSTS